jgi:hypothetical protein
MKRQMPRGTNKEIMDAACERAWRNRLRVEPIVRRELYGRLRDQAFRDRPDFIQSDDKAEYLESLGLWVFDLD